MLHSIGESLIMKLFVKTRVKFIVLLVAGSQLLFTFCSKRLQPVPAVHNIENHADHKKLNDIKEIKIDKELNTHNTSPDEIIETAQQYLGVPHCMGGTTMKCIDCSGLLMAVFAKKGIQLPHNSQDQSMYGRKIGAMNELKRGDLVFFNRSYNTNHYITHSGIYIGDNKFIHTSSRIGVTITSLNDPYWKMRFVFGRRVFE